MPKNLPEDQAASFTEKLVQWSADELIAELECICNDTGFGSPIEKAFFMAWSTYNHVVSRHVFLCPQFLVKHGTHSYRIDFAIIDEDIKLAIELDGHDFHERTREQVDQRNKRDRDLQLEGWSVIHFSGKKVLDLPHVCCDEVADLLLGMQGKRLCANGAL